MVSAMAPSRDELHDGLAIAVCEVGERDAHAGHLVVAGFARHSDYPPARAHRVADGELEHQRQFLADFEQEIAADEGAPDGEVVGVELDVALHFVGGVGDRDRQLDGRTRMFAKVAPALRRGHGPTWSGATSRSATLSSPCPAPGASMGPRDTRVAATVATAPGGSESKAAAGTANPPS